MLRSVVALLIGIIALAASTAHAGGRAATGIRDGDWSGVITFRVAGTPARVAVDLQLHGTTAMVALGPGHSALQRVHVQRGGGKVRFSLPGIPTPLTLALQLRGRSLSGSATQSTARGTVRLTLSKPTPARFLGSYRLPDGDTLIVSDYRRINYPIWLADTGTDLLRGLYSRSATTFSIGAGVSLRNPTDGTVRFARDGSSLTETLGGKPSVQAMRLSYRQQEVFLPSGNVTLAGTLTLPSSPAPGGYPAVVLMHGSGPSLRDEDQNWVGFLAAHGIAVLSMDKRGVGQSGGTYAGDVATEDLVKTLAGDAMAGGQFLRAQPGIDPKRIGLLGGSQAGWIIPTAAAAAPSLFTFAVILSGPVVSVGESDLYSALTGQGANIPSIPQDQIEARVRAAGPSGFDPRPYIKNLRIPVLWIYGGKDQHQPTNLDIPVLVELKAETGADFSWVVFPDANHGLCPTQHGLNSEADAAPGLAPGLFAAMGSWLHSHTIGTWS